MPIAALPGKGYRLLDGYFLPPVSFTADEVAALALGGAFVRDRVDVELHCAADDALRKLAGVLPPERQAVLTRYQREMLFVDDGTGRDDPALAALRRAIRDRRVVRLRYHGRRPTATEREVEPVSLVHVNHAWHLVGYCRLRRDGHLFRLDRIDHWEPLGEPFDLADRHAFGPHDERPRDHPEARIRFDPAVVRWVRERQPFVFLREEVDDDGPAFVYLLRDDRELLSGLLAWGAAVEIVEPPSLRARLAAEARAILVRHATDEEPERAFEVVGGT